MRVALALGACCLLAGTMRAGPITFQFTGTVTQVPVDEVFGDIQAGRTISGSYTFESTSIDGDPGDASIGSYVAPSGDPYSFNVMVGGHSFSTNFLLGLGVFNAAVDQYTVLAEDFWGTGHVHDFSAEPQRYGVQRRQSADFAAAAECF
jgi:hypothetical protein